MRLLRVLAERCRGVKVWNLFRQGLEDCPVGLEEFPSARHRFRRVRGGGGECRGRMVGSDFHRGRANRPSLLILNPLC